MDKRIIPLKSLLNCRTLGGLPSAFGGSIRDNILYRSAAWDHLTPEDGAVLRDKCGITLDVDLRTDAEVFKGPDKSVSGVTYLAMPVSHNHIPGVSREMEPGKDITEDMLPNLHEMYRGLVSLPQYTESFSQILHTIMNYRDGAVLWHCTAGKDRCGMTAFFLETMLGVDLQTRVQDYMMTNRDFTPQAWKHFFLILLTKRNLTFAKKIFATLVAKESYLEAALQVIDRDFGGMDNYLHNQLHITQEEIEDFRRYALTDYR